MHVAGHCRAVQATAVNCTIIASFLWLDLYYCFNYSASCFKQLYFHFKLRPVLNTVWLPSYAKHRNGQNRCTEW